jgi:hypothetical protein
MTDGPWMSLAAYAIQAAIVIAIGVWLARQLSGTKRPTAMTP